MLRVLTINEMAHLITQAPLPRLRLDIHLSLSLISVSFSGLDLSVNVEAASLFWYFAELKQNSGRIRLFSASSQPDIQYACSNIESTAT